MFGFIKKNAVVMMVLMSTILIGSRMLHAQGISRNNGIGFRPAFWKTNRSEALIKITSNRVELGGAGTWFTFFSRFRNDWFYEFHLGAFASVIAMRTDNSIIESEDVTLIIPFLLGARYDFLSTRSQSALQPYFSFGAGPYWITSVDKPGTDLDTFTGTVDSGLMTGGYLGGGMNIALASWLAFNVDLKYHFVAWDPDSDFSGVDLGVGVNFMWGQKRELVRIVGVKTIVADIYPAYYQFYNLYPLAMVTVKNMSGSSIEVNIRSNIRYFSERPKETGFIKIKGKETKDIPITAFLGNKIRQVKQRENAVIDITVEARAGSKITKKISSQVMIHNPNSWNGEMDKLVFFVKSDDDRILKWGRNLVNGLETESSDLLRNFIIAKAVFDTLSAAGIRYHRDPNIPFYQDDRVNFAHETIGLKSGDCDDLVVLYASLLESLGINTAFVEVRDPEKELAHLYLIFDTGLSTNMGKLISTNEKRYLIRNNRVGKQTIWIPVETTLIKDGFAPAWKTGALEFLQNTQIRNGLAEGWVNIIEVE